jgi:hypothetical protein
MSLLWDLIKHKVVRYTQNPVTGRIIKTLWSGTQAQYDAIVTKDPDTLYIIVAG